MGEATSSEDKKIRRIRLPQIVDSQGNISFQVLESLVNQFISSPESISCVKLKYKDIDSDLIDLVCTDDLLDAVDQYLKDGSLRVFAKVEHCDKNENKQEKKVPSDHFHADSSPHAESSKKSPPRIDKLLGAVVDVVDQSLNRNYFRHFQKSESRPNHDNQEEKQGLSAKVDRVKQSAPAEPANADKNKQDENKARVDASARSKSETSDSKIETPHEKIVNEVECEKEATVESEKDATVESKEESTEQKEEDEEPFIHGGHTCDSCLATPIVGKRFHATNLPNFDLCEKCKNNYKDEDIKFEVVEHACDRPMQQRWRRWQRHGVRPLRHFLSKSPFGINPPPFSPHVCPLPDPLHVKDPAHMEAIAIAEAIVRSLQDYANEEEKRESNQDKENTREHVEKDVEVDIAELPTEESSTEGCNQSVAGEDKNEITIIKDEVEFELLENCKEELKNDAKKPAADKFNKDISTKKPITSLPTSDSEESAANTYSADIPSTPSLQPTQRDRWASQLQKLKELGFDDEVQYVEILERLTAANIGVGSNDEVTVAQVVQQLFK